MTEYEVKMQLGSLLYLNARSPNKMMLKDIERAVKKVVAETYPSEAFEYE